MSQPGKTFVVIGGASGIGLATARDLLANGHTVVIADLDAAAARAEELGGTSEGVTVDVSDESSVAALFDGVVERHGSFDGVVNCAGVSTLGLVVEHDVAEFRRVIDVSLTGAFIVLKHAGSRITDGGSLVTLSSLNARQPGAGLVAYCSAKAGLLMLTQVAALELAGRRIRVNAVSPGITDTPMQEKVLREVSRLRGLSFDELSSSRTNLVPLRRSAPPSEMAGVVMFLLSDPAAYITGQTIYVDGGYIMSS